MLPLVTRECFYKINDTNFSSSYFPLANRIVSIGAEPHVNTCFKHFYYFVSEFDLIPAKEMEPLIELVKQICKD